MFVFLIILAILSYTTAILAFGRGPLTADSNLVGTIINFIGMLVPLVLFVLSSVSIKESKPTGLWWALAGGVAIGIFTLALTRIFASGQAVSFVTPLVYGGSVALSAIISFLFFGEKIPMLQAVGIGVIIIGIFVVVFSKYQQGVA